MPLLDEQGRLFGLINIVDAIVVIAVIGVVVVAGLVLVPAGETDTQPGETRYATVVFNDQPEAIASQITVGDTLSAVGGGGETTISDTYFSPSRGDNTSRLYVRIRYDSNNPPQQQNRQFRAGRVMYFGTDEYGGRGKILAIDRPSDTLPTSRTNVTIEATVPASVSSSLDRGDTFTFNDTTLTEVTSVSAVPVANGTRSRLRVDLTLQTIRLGYTRYFAGNRVQTGSHLPLVTDSHWIPGTVVHTAEYRQR
ncbi:DUF4330 family protein [Halapricum sp. CBA1109]|uniref:DUF4330 family protein n=1 Tax=Halapricum sp. CBA1109 TaxID=2668068 RepID=UPI0012F9387F|nr:DUF4330 family protein [Halapricum sp. CBA1109]MUV88821.1 DUF4330 family protein [Halapricum sp. CBA1109]